ncbi:MAG: 2,3-bisphosphoglycerate-independent phosphoglycerate mutase [Chitinophagales bacterium]
MELKYKKVLLIIMDGWAKELDKSRSAIAKAATPNVDNFYKKYSNSELVTFGKQVGLPDGQMGNSEVGHMNIGAGRVVYQDFMRINNAVENDSLAENKNLVNLFTYAKQNNKPLHLMGLFSNGGVHSHINHLIAICKYAHQFGLTKIFVHAFTDGRDCAPTSGIGFVNEFEIATAAYNCKIVSIIGRYYAMDRDNRWERIKLAYDLLVHGKGAEFSSAESAISDAYSKEVSDEFILASKIVSEENTNIKDGDAVLCFNFRTDRCREITQVLTQENMPNEGMKSLDLNYVTMTRYKDTFTNIPVLFDKDNLQNTLGEIIAKNGKTQFRIAETEKYPHVTFFFSGGREKTFDGETRKVIASPKVATYDLQPEMSAEGVKDAVIEEIARNKPDFIALNFANTDMVGHTGVFEAAVKAAETVDAYVKEIVDLALEKDYDILVTADHGNSDIMKNLDGSVHTAHTKNMVPLFFISNTNKSLIKNGKLGDLAPTILTLMGLEIPKEMTGEILLD